MRHGESPTPETLHHSHYEPTHTAGKKHYRNRQENMLDALHQRKLLTDMQHSTGTQIAAWFYLSQLQNFPTSSWGERVDYGSSAGLNLTERKLHARKKLAQLEQAIAPMLWNLLERVCAHDEGLEHMEHTIPLPRRSAKTLLAAALDQASLYLHGRDKNLHA